MIAKLDPYHKILGLDNTSIVDYWAWAYSDILSNRNRSIFAEFLVGKALNSIDSPRIEWNYIDFDYGGKTVEVKSSAYLQSWNQKKPSTIKYDIEKRKQVDIASKNVPDNIGEPVRFADCYVFCLFTEKDVIKANIMDISSWEFYVVPTSEIDNRFKNQKSISLSVLKEISKSVKYSELKACVDSKLALNRI